MAMNPMQRRARNSFLIGFLVSLILMTVVVIGLLMQIKTINEAKEALEQLQQTVYVASADLESGQVVTLDEHFRMDTVQTTMDISNVIDDTTFQFLDEEGIPTPKYNQDGSEKTKNVMMKVNVPAGAIVTKDMLVEVGEETTNTQRIQEYTMIQLPSHLKNGQYIDVRMSLPTGQDYIVLSKKRVLGTDAQTIWLKVDEFEISLMNSAIVESYQIMGAKLYATLYSEAGMQEKAQSTYTVSRNVYDLMINNPNILNDIKVDYANRLNHEQRVLYFDSILTQLEEDEKRELVNTGVSEDRATISATRLDYVSQLEGTEDVGFTGK